MRQTWAMVIRLQVSHKSNRPQIAIASEHVSHHHRKFHHRLLKCPIHWVTLDVSKRLLPIAIWLIQKNKYCFLLGICFCADIDVQFGALDFGSEETFDSISDKFQTSSLGRPLLTNTYCHRICGQLYLSCILHSQIIHRMWPQRPMFQLTFKPSLKVRLPYKLN